MAWKSKTLRKIALQASNAFFFCLLGLLPAYAQFDGYVSPQTVSNEVMNAVTAAVATPNTNSTKACVPAAAGTCGIQNLGQNVHFLNYTTTGPITELDIRLEGSLNGTTWFPISDDANAVNGSVQPFGSVYGVGYYPFVRANLVAITGGGTLTAYYAGTSATSGPLLGSYNPAQQIQKTVFAKQPAGSNASGTINAPFYSGLGFALVYSTAGFPASSQLQVTGISASGAQETVVSLLGTGPFQIVPIPAIIGENLFVNYTAGGASAGTMTINYVFIQPGAATAISGPHVQPITAGMPSNLNSETVSGTNAAAVKTINSGGFRVHLYSVNARCSAGTAQLQVINVDLSGNTFLWTTGAAEVGTTSYHLQWDPGLATNWGDLMIVELTACGGGNVGTLDVQASQF